MVVATYHGGNTDNEEINYTNWNEWIAAIREDFRKFIEYRLNDIDNSKNLIKHLRSVSKNLSNTCPLGIDYLGIFKIDIGEFYTIIEYPVYDGKFNRYNCAHAIISRDYRDFVFVDNVNSSPTITHYEVSEKVLEEEFVPGIDLIWSEENLEDNLEYLRGDADSVLELGGFADEPEDVDGDYQSFNYCLAIDYASSMYDEDFESLGYIGSNLFNKISYWLNYNGESVGDDLKFIQGIPKGEFMTAFNRTFAEAVFERRIGDIAESLIYNGNIRPSLYFTAIAFSEPIEDILNQILGYINDPKEYDAFVNELMILINEEYMRLDGEEKTQFIQRIKKYLNYMPISHNKDFLENNYGFEWFDDAFVIKGRERKLSGEISNK